MRRFIQLFVLVLICAHGAKAQGIFNQKGSQVKRLAEQVALLRTYSGYLKKGYRIADKGLATINDIKNGDFSIHKTFFGSLKAVNPNIRKYSRVAEILLMETEMLLTSPKVKVAAQQSGMYGEAELEEFKRVFNNVLEHCARILDDLGDLLTDGKLEMKDDERIRRIDHLHLAILNAYSFHRSLCIEISQVASYQEHEEAVLKSEQHLHGIKEK